MQRSQPTEYAFGPYRIRSDERVLRLDGRRIALAPKVVETLIVFLTQPDRFVSKAQLIERIWPEGFVDEANLTQNIYLLRKMFAEHECGARIENVPKRGYRLVAPAAAAEDAAAEYGEVELIAAPSARRDAVAAGADLDQPLARDKATAKEPAAAAKERSEHSIASRSFPVGRIVPSVVIAGALLLGIGGPNSARLARGAASPYRLPSSALQRYLLGRYYLNRGTQRDLRSAIAAFTDVVRDVPQSALGYAGLAESFTSSTFSTSDPVARTRLGARAIALANEAIVREPDSTDAYAALGAVQTSIEHDDVAAASSFDTSLRLDPRNLDALVWYGTDAMNAGRVTQARRLFERAMSVDPTSPGPIASLAWADFLARDFVDAAAFSRQLLRAHQLESIARITLASSYVEMGDYTRALPEVEALRRHRDTQTQGLALLSQIYAIRGSPRLALDVLAQLEAQTDPAAIGSWDILALAAAYARIGREDAAFVWLARIRSSERRQITRDPRFDRLRNARGLRDWLSG